MTKAEDIKHGIPSRRKMPKTRRGFTAKNEVGSYKFYVTVNFYDDDTSHPGEVFITCAKEGSTLGGMCDMLGTTISLALQHGVPWALIEKQYRHTRFEPMGHSTVTDEDYSSLAEAIADTITRILLYQADMWDSGATPERSPDGNPESVSLQPARAGTERSSEARPEVGSDGPAHSEHSPGADKTTLPGASPRGF